MALDQGRRVAINGHRFDHVGIKRALAQEFGRAGPFGRRLENFDECFADDLAFPFGIGHALEAAQKQGGGVLALELDAKMTGKNLPHRFRFAPAQQTIIDKDAGELPADGFVQQGGRHAGIHPAAQSKNHPLAPHLRPNLLHGLLDEMAHGPLLAAPADAMHEIGNDLPPPRRMDHFGMELQPEEFPVAVLDGGKLRVVGRGDGLEPVRRRDQFVPMRIPDLQGIRQIGEQGRERIGHQQGALAVLAFKPARHLASQQMAH